jgi:hypothetical protein
VIEVQNQGAGISLVAAKLGQIRAGASDLTIGQFVRTGGPAKDGAPVVFTHSR